MSARDHLHEVEMLRKQSEQAFRDEEFERAAWLQRDAQIHATLALTAVELAKARATREVAL